MPPGVTPLPLPDWQMAAAYTGFVTWAMQELKKWDRWRNNWCIVAAPLLGLLLALGALAAIHKLGFENGGISTDWALAFKSALEGLMGGGSSELVYTAQKALPFQLLAPGPDNHPADMATAAAASRPQGAAANVPTPVPPGALGAGLVGQAG